jgi:hypothetical protein
MSGRADAIALVHDLALVALGVGLGLFVLGVLVIHETRMRGRNLRRRLDNVERHVEQIIPSRSLAEPTSLETRRLAHKHGAAADRRANP